jgi:hypothetical protein
MFTIRNVTSSLLKVSNLLGFAIMPCEGHKCGKKLIYESTYLAPTEVIAFGDKSD